MNLKAASILVTGGASGLGAATVRQFIGSVENIVIADTNRTSGELLAAELGQTTQFVACDVTNEQELGQAVSAATARAPLRVLVTCAGIATAERTLGRDGPLPLERFNRVIQINLIGTFNAIRIAATSMAQNEADDEGQRGVIICTASVAAFDGQVGQAAYSASKAGVAGMILPLARELSRLGIRVMGIAPGIFDTPMMAGLPEAARASLGAQVPFPSRLGRPEEYAALVEHIVNNVMLNGEVIRLDGAIRMAPK